MLPNYVKFSVLTIGAPLLIISAGPKTKRRSFTGWYVQFFFQIYRPIVVCEALCVANALLLAKGIYLKRFLVVRVFALK